MPIEISKDEALKILMWAFENRERCPLNDIEEKTLISISNILTGNHKTYRYILITQILAKATNPNAEALALQAGAPFPGAFDSRSLCHKIIVPFERKYLANGLGGSNEPYLNKPARFTHLSTNNAVRAGTDRLTLNLLIDLLKNLDQSSAKKLLCYSISVILKQAIKRENMLSIATNFSNSLDLYHFMRKLLGKSFQGEICVLIVGTMEKMFYHFIDKGFRVICHQTNEAGASSKEIGDIDVYHGNSYYYSIEVKDKNFTAEDVDFALNKMFVAQAVSGSFVYGPNAKYDPVSVFKCIEIYENSKFIIIFEDIFTYIKHMLMITTNINFELFKNILSDTAKEINAKDETLKWLSEISKNN